MFAKLFRRGKSAEVAGRPVPPVRLVVEGMEDRLTPRAWPSIEIGFVGGELLVAPPAADTPAHTGSINHQVSQIVLPTGEVLPGHGLKTAEAHNSVIDWTRT